MTYLSRDAGLTIRCRLTSRDLSPNHKGFRYCQDDFGASHPMADRAAIDHDKSAEANHHVQMLANDAGYEHSCGPDKPQTVIDAAGLEDGSLDCRP